MFKKRKKQQKYISLREAAWLYGCTQRHMNLMARQGKLKAVKIGRNWFTSLKWLQEYMDSLDKKDKFPVLIFKKNFTTLLVIVLIFIFVFISILFVFSKPEIQEPSFAIKGFYNIKSELGLVFTFINNIFPSKFFIPYYPIPEISDQSYLSIKHLYQRLRNIENLIEESRVSPE